MDRRRIAELRMLLVEDAAGGGRRCGDLLAEVRSVIGELLALADAALRIREVYDRPGELQVMQLACRMMLTVSSAMRDLEHLEVAARMTS